MNLANMNSKAQEINTPTLTIKDNVIAFTDYFIQISNISEAAIAPIPQLPYPIIAFILCIIGLLLTFMGMGHTASSVILGLIFLVIGVMIIYHIYLKNKNRGEVLILSLNSGKSFYFKCYDKFFLAKVLDVLKSCVNKEVHSIVVDFSNSVITNSPIVGGDKNQVEVNV